MADLTKSYIETHRKAVNTPITRKLGVKSLVTYYNVEHDIDGPTKEEVMEEVLLGGSIVELDMFTGKTKYLVKGDTAVRLDPSVFR